MNKEGWVKKPKSIGQCCYGLSYIPPNLYVEALTPSVMLFGDGALGK